jgi:adenylate cyclase
VDDLDLQTVADRSGVELGYLRRLVDLGLVHDGGAAPYTDADVRRVQMLQAIERDGISLDGLATVVTSGGGLGLEAIDEASYQVFSPISSETFAAVSERTGVPMEVLMAIREAVGGPAAGPDDRMREDELAILPLAEFQLSLGFRPIAVERALPVYGDSLRRIAETEADWWRSEIVAPMVAQGMTTDDLGRRAVEITPRLSEVTVAAVLAIYRAQQRHAWITNIASGVAQALDRAGLQPRVKQDPAICFLDITGYTRLTQEHGDAAAAQLAERLARLVQRTSNQHGGRPVKWLGDGVMFHFPDPAQGILAALEMVAGVEAAGLPPAHVGLHAGPVHFQQGDYYGQTVNLAARIGEYARPGEVLVGQSVVDAAGEIGVDFRPIGPVELKGAGEAIVLYSAARRP